MKDIEMLDFVRDYEYTEYEVFQSPIITGHLKYEKRDAEIDPEIEKLIEEEMGGLL
jgi:hypothetical protein